MVTYEDGTEERKELSLMERFKHIYIKEVVREPRMNYQRVPRLGAFMAVPLVYKSCLFDESLAEAVANWQDVQQRKAQQDMDIEAWEQQQQQAKDAAEAAGQEFVPEEKEWPEVKLDEFRTEA